MKGSRLVSTITLAALLLGAAPPARAAINSNAYGLRTHEVFFNGVSHVTGVKRAAYTGLAWRASVRNTGGAIAKDYAVPYYPLAEFEMRMNGAQALARAITDLSAGRQVRLSTQVRTPSLDPAAPEWTNLGDSEMAYFEFPKLDAQSKSAGYFKTAVVPTAFVPMTDRPAGASAPVSPTAAGSGTSFLENGFVVTIPGMDCSHIVSVDGIRIEGPAAASSTVAGAELTDSRPAVTNTNGNITIRATHASSRGLRDWMLANQAARPTKREITIQLFSVGGGQPLLTLHGVGLGLMSLVPDAEDTEGLPGSTATLFVERWEVTAPGGPGLTKGKVDLAAPGLGIPVGRK